MASDELVYEATSSLLADHPDIEPALRELLAIDAEGPWTFEEVPLDSGRFGEMVSREIAVKADGAYRLADRDAVAAALDGDGFDEGDSVVPDVSLPTSLGVEWTTAAGLGAALALVALVRSMHLPHVFRDGYIISPANDPYFYRYWQHRLLEISASPVDLTPITDIPGRASTRPFTHAANWWLAALVGDPDIVAALLPVVAAVLLGAVLFLFARTVTGDDRIAVASVLMLAVIPVHVRYTAMGFLEHRLHQYLWLGILLLGIAWLATTNQRLWRAHAETAWRVQWRVPRVWATVALVAVATPVVAHSFRGSALLFIPVAGYVFLKGVMDIQHGRRPLHDNLPLLAGLGIGSILTYLPYHVWGWHEADTVLVLTPALVAIGAGAVLVLGEATRLAGRSAREYLVGGITVGVVLIGLFRLLRPDDFDRAADRATDSLLGRDFATETVGTFAADAGLFLRPLFQFGPLVFVGLPVLAIASWYVVMRYHPGMLLAVVGGWTFFVLAAIQLRFAAQLSFFIAFFAGIGLVYAMAAIGLVRTPRVTAVEEEDASHPGLLRGDDAVDARSRMHLPGSIQVAGLILLTVLIVIGFNLALAPGFVSEFMYDDEIKAVSAIIDHQEETNRSAADSAVIAHWNYERFYNFFVADDGLSYNRGGYESFINHDHPDDAFEDQGGSYGYLSTVDYRGLGAAQEQLHADYGLGSSPASHFQLLYAGDGFSVFAIVEGAQLTITGGENGSIVTIATDVEVPGASFTYDQTVTLDADGTATVRVPYPGEYTVGDATASVSQLDVEHGETVNVTLSDTP